MSETTHSILRDAEELLKQHGCKGHSFIRAARNVIPNVPVSARPEAERIQAALPSGWMAVPVKATIAMHNAAALGFVYEPPRLKMDDDGYVRVEHAAPDWSWVWSKMIEAAPSLKSQLPQSSGS